MKRLLTLVLLVPSVTMSKIIIVDDVVSSTAVVPSVLEKRTVSGTLTPAVVVAPVNVPKQIVPVSLPKSVWLAKTGSTLRESILEWAKEAGWRVLWMPEDLDYPIIADLRYEGSFERAVTEVFRAYEKAERPFLVDGNSTQKALIVMEKKAVQ